MWILDTLVCLHIQLLHVALARASLSPIQCIQRRERFKALDKRIVLGVSASKKLIKIFDCAYIRVIHHF